ncbi:MAG: tetratricopeptide repeat protein [Treponema sp.]|nr:tetratricopeptide repeat protein [Treponema sp.]
MHPRAGSLLWPVLFFSLLILSCGTKPAARKPDSGPPNTVNSQPPASTGGVVEELRSLTESGIPSNLLRALDLVRSRDLGGTEFGRVMNGINVTLIRTIYPDLQTQLPNPDFPSNHAYSRIIREAERGNYTPPSPESGDYLEYVLPFLALYRETGDRLLTALPDLQKASAMNSNSVLAALFIGIVYERTGRLNEAVAAFTRCYDLSRECYPAALGLARVMLRIGQNQEALRLLSDLVIRYPDYHSIKRQLALTYYQSGDWARADPAIAEILQKDSRDAEFILMRARVLVEQGQFLQAQVPLDLYQGINPNNRLYLFLRARVQAEGLRNRDAALNYLRSILRSTVRDDEVSVYTARLLMESSRPEDQNEGRQLLRSLLEAPDPSPVVLDLALQDAIRRQAWREALPWLNRLLDERRSSQDLVNAYIVERGLGNNARSLSFARELYERNPANDEGAVSYFSALIDTGRIDEAGRMIESRLNQAPGGPVKSRYYYLRSRIRTNEDSVMNDLRSSLFEDPRNLDSIISMFDIYHRRRDGRRAVYYLKQALALDPNNPQLKRYEAEYASLM